MINTNKFEHRQGLIMKREDAFSLTQSQMTKNLSQLILPMFGTTWGVIADLDSGGIMDATDFKVTKASSSQISIESGSAISQGGELIYSESSQTARTIDSDGIHRVYVEAKTIRASSGKENYLPGRAGVNGILTLENADNAIQINDEFPTNTIKLAQYCSTGTVIPANIIGRIVTSVNDPFIDSNDVGIVNVSWSSGWTASPQQNDDDYYIVQVGKEYLGCFAISETSITIGARGLFGTSPEVHRSFSGIVYPGIIDLRQQNVAKLNLGTNAFISSLKKGVINFNDGGGDRFLATKKIADIPNTPEVTDKSLELVWLNKHASGGFITPDITEAVSVVKGYSERIDTTQADIMDIRETLLASDDEEEKVSLQMTLSTKQAEIAQLKAGKQQGTIALSKTAAATNNTTKKYVAAVTFNQPTLIDQEQITKYEATVKYSSIASSQLVGSTSSQIFSKTFLPTGHNEFGDYIYTYDDQPGIDYRSIYIPIVSGEKVIVKVRSVTDSLTFSSWSDEITYSFSDIDDQDIAIMDDISSLLTPDDPFASGLITQETIELITTTLGTVNAFIAQIDNNSSDIIEIKDAMKAYEDSVDDKINILMEAIPDNSDTMTSAL